MADLVDIRSHMLTDAEITALLRNKNYKMLLKFLKDTCGDTFCTEQSGETFEKWINWCARNSRNVADARDLLRRLFSEFYGQLPTIARVNLSYLAYESGYDHSRFGFAKFKYLSREIFVSSRLFLTSLHIRIREYVVARCEPSVQVSYFRQSAKEQSSYGTFKESLVKRITR